MNDTPYIEATRRWLHEVIIAYGICPFAEKVSGDGGIRLQLDTATGMEECLTNLITECVRLDQTPDIATTLIIYPQAFRDFDAYLDFLELAEQLLLLQGYEGVYQLASFHPDYAFDGAANDDPANYTNRSPYPMLHLLREAGLAQAIAHHPDPEGIPERNIELARQLGLAKMQALLAACYQK